MSESRQGDTFQIGQILNNTYRVEEVLGRGGTSEVYRARSEISGRVVALKVLNSELSSNEDYLVLMNREEEIRDVRHEAVVRYSENHRTADGHIYLVMDYVDGPGLDKKMREGGMSAEDLLVVASRVAEGLVATHAHNIVHRDLSPDNIILQGGDPAKAVIIDFGIAKDTNPGAETIVGNEFAGKYAYAAPEQLSGKSDARSDIYALGALLLATYRGAPPDVGKNPMEVIGNKSTPLDTSGVPEPLKSLIDKMTDPDPDKRLQTAADVIEEISGPGGRTVIISPESKAPGGAGRKPAKRPARGAAGKKGTGARALAIVIVLLLAGAGGVYYSGIWKDWLRPSLPKVSPYTLVAEKRPGASPQVVGYMPSEETRAAVVSRMAGLGGDAKLTLARGDIGETWGDDILSLIGEVSKLEEWRIVVSGNTVRVTGLAADAAEQNRVRTALSGPAMPASLKATVEILRGPRILPVESVRTILREHADCGALELQDPPAGGYAMGSQVSITGNVASPETRANMFDALAKISGDRRISIKTELLNPQLCLIDSRLPAAPKGGLKVIFGYGDRSDPNPDGSYAVGENPVIDIELPADVQRGFLWVSIVDVTGNVYHLLPNIKRSDNSVLGLRGGRSGPVRIRVAYGLAEAAGDPAKLAFMVDETFGKSRIVVMRSSGLIFDELRPTTESVAGYAEALAARLGEGAATVRSLDTRLLYSR
ncbi:MAG: protein kinase [Paracoccaceae bacterium]